MFISTIATKVSLSTKQEFFDLLDLKNGSKTMKELFSKCEDPEEVFIPRATAYLQSLLSVER